MSIKHALLYLETIVEQKERLQYAIVNTYVQETQTTMSSMHNVYKL